MEVAEKLGVSPAQVAMKWTMQKDYTSIPIVGGRKLHQIEDSLQSTTVDLPAELMKRYETVIWWLGHRHPPTFCEELDYRWRERLEG